MVICLPLVGSEGTDMLVIVIGMPPSSEPSVLYATEMDVSMRRKMVELKITKITGLSDAT